MLYRVKTLSQNGILGTVHVPFESSIELSPLPEEAVKNIEDYIKLVSKINGIDFDLFALVNKENEIIAVNSDIHILLIPFDL